MNELYLEYFNYLITNVLYNILCIVVPVYYKNTFVKMYFWGGVPKLKLT